MSIPVDPHSGCDCCGYGFDIDIISVPPIPIETVVCNNVVGGEIAKCWEFTVAGMVDNNCTLCNNFNGTWTIIFLDPQPVPNQCQFELPLADTLPTKVWSTSSSTCGNSNNRFILQARNVGGGQIVQLSAASSGLFVYRMTPADFDPLGPNVLTLFGTVNLACTGHPATITIEPALCP